jgi:predicted nucleotidyltransferase
MALSNRIRDMKVIAMEKKSKYSIDEIICIIAPIAKRYGVRKISLFGSYAKGEASEDSDLDFRIVDRGTLRGLIQLSGFQLSLQDGFGVPIDVLTDDAISADFRSRIAMDEVVVYEQ